MRKREDQVHEWTIEVEMAMRSAGRDMNQRGNFGNIKREKRETGRRSEVRK